MSENTAQQLLVINTKQGKIKGVIQNEVAVFKGIPYAKPPLGKLRFAPRSLVRYKRLHRIWF